MSVIFRHSSLARRARGGIADAIREHPGGLPLLQSRPNGAGLELFVDFAWNDGYYLPFSTDGDRFNYNWFEQHDIYNAWRDVASAFSFLDVNVTTVLPYNNHNFAWIAITNEFVWGGEGLNPASARAAALRPSHLRDRGRAAGPGSRAWPQLGHVAQCRLRLFRQQDARVYQ